MPQAIEQLGEVQVEITQERIHGDAVGQGDAQQPPVFPHPALQRGGLAIDQARAELLVRHEPFVGHGADRLELVLTGQVHVAGADEAAREVALENVHHGFLYPVGEAPPGAEVGQLETGQFIGAGLGLEPVEVVIQALADLFDHHLTIAVAVAHFADDRQQRDFVENHVQPRSAHADRQLPGAIQANLHEAQVEAEQAEKADEVWLDERDLLQVGQLVVRDADIGQLLDLVTDFRQIGREVLAIAAAELPLHLGVGVVVQHRLHHAQLVEVGVQQVLHDSLGECAVRHARLFRVDKTSVYGIAVDCDGERSIKNPAVAVMLFT
ncbi:hypothetical protein D3C81_809340 [compost metagenome]